MCLADKFPESLPGFQKMFPDDNACALYLESIRWRDGFVVPAEIVWHTLGLNLALAGLCAAARGFEP